MKTSIATVSISGDLPEKLDAVAAAGFTGVEIFEHDFLVHDTAPADVGKMVRERGLETTLFQPFRDFEGMPEPHRARSFDRAERKFHVVAELGAGDAACGVRGKGYLCDRPCAAGERLCKSADLAQLLRRCRGPLRHGSRTVREAAEVQHPLRSGRERSFLSDSQPFLRRRMLFEIVMREGAYDGYGGPNAPFRIAAQRRLLDRAS